MKKNFKMFLVFICVLALFSFFLKYKYFRNQNNLLALTEACRLTKVHICKKVKGSGLADSSLKCTAWL